MIKQEIELEIVESLQEDIGGGIARIPSQIMNALKIVSGDIIEIKGKQQKSIQRCQTKIYQT